MIFTKQEFRDALGQFVTGVTIVTCVGQSGCNVGVTINSFNSVSLDPPLVLFSLGKKAFSFDDVRLAKQLVINVLSQEQIELCERFAAPHADKWRDIDFAPNAIGAPVLTGNLATFECVPAMTYEGGDHLIIVSRVERLMHHDTDRLPLVFFRGVYRQLQP